MEFVHWEYRSEQCHDRHDVTGVLNDADSRGWQPVEVVYAARSGPSGGHFVVFLRRLREVPAAAPLPPGLDRGTR